MRSQSAVRRLAARLLPRPVKDVVRRIRGRKDYDGFADELAFWECELSGRGDYPHTIRNCSTPRLRHLAFPNHFLPFFRKLRDEAGDRIPRVLDVGSGPLSTLVWGHDEGLFKLVAVDALASAYKQLLERHGILMPMTLEEGTGERLLDLFQWQWFDACHANNSLDHTVSPRSSLAGMVSVTRPGGLVMIGGYVKEGTKERWQGLHQHDLWLQGDELMHTNRAGAVRSLSKDLPLEILHRRLDGEEPGAEMAIVWRRR